MTPRRIPRIGLGTALLLAALALTGCTDAAPGYDAPTAPVDTPELPTSAPETPEPEPTTAPVTRFHQPEDCTELLPASTMAAFERRSLELLGGPGSVYPQYFADPTPEERRGGISCVFGSEVIATDTIVISVAPLSPATRPQVMEQLIDDGLNESESDGVISYEKAGDEQTVQSELHRIDGSSWISVITSPGGEQAHTAAFELVEAVAASVIR